MESKRNRGKVLWIAQLGAVWVMVASGCYYDVEETLYGTEGCDVQTVSFASDIAPLVSQKCAGCHSGTSPSGGLTLQSHAQVAGIGMSGALVDRTHRPAGDGLAMPPSGRLSECELSKIQNWVNQGSLDN